MNCIDPEARAHLFASAAEPDAWQAHLDACPACRAILVESEPEDVHPSGAALVRFAQAPLEMDPAVRELVASHLEHCDACAEALVAIPPIEPPARRARFGAAGLASLAVAATVALAFFVGITSGGSGPDGGDSRPTEVAVIVLSNQRGAVAESFPATATVVQFQPVLAEPVAIGESVRLEIEDEVGRVVVSESITIQALDPDWGRPLIPVLRSRLPDGALKVRIGLASGTRAEFLATLPPSSK